MKAQSERPDISEMPPYRLGRHWNTIQVYLIPGIEDDIGVWMRLVGERRAEVANALARDADAHLPVGERRPRLRGEPREHGSQGPSPRFQEF